MADKIAPLIAAAIARADVNAVRAFAMVSDHGARRTPVRLLTRVLSLRVIVIVAALSVVALVITLGAWVWFGVTNDQYSQLDRRLDSVSSLGDISSLLRSAQRAGTRPAVRRTASLVRTARIDGATVSIPRDMVLPQFDIRLCEHEHRRRGVPGSHLRRRGRVDRRGRAARRNAAPHRRTAPARAADLRRRHHRHGPGRLGDVVDHDQPVPRCSPSRPGRSTRSPIPTR